MSDIQLRTRRLSPGRQGGARRLRALRHDHRPRRDDRRLLGAVAARLPDAQQLHQRPQPGVARDDHRRRPDACRDRRRTRSVDRLRREPARHSRHRLHRPRRLPIPLAILLVVALGALIGLINGFIVTKMKVNSVIATLGVGTIITGLRLRLFGRRADRRRRAGSLPAALARPLAVRHPQQHRHHGDGARRAVGAGRAHGDRPGDPGGRRQCRRGAACRHQCRPHQDPGLRHLRHVRGARPASCLPRGSAAAPRVPPTPICSPPLPPCSSARRPCATASSMSSAPGRRADHRLRLQRAEYLRRPDLQPVSCSRAPS